jgi:hypothetical protein
MPDFSCDGNFERKTLSAVARRERGVMIAIAMLVHRYAQKE